MSQHTFGLHLVLKSVQMVKEIHQDLDDQDTDHIILLAIIKTAKYGTNELGGRNLEEKYTPGSYKNECKSWFCKK